MTRDDLVRRLAHVAGELHDCPMCEPHVEAIEAAAAALAAPPAAPPEVEVYPNSDRGLAQMFPGVSVPLLRGIQEAAFRAGREDALKHMSPADLVAIVRDLQEADAVLKHVASARAMRRWHEALNKVVAYALERTPAAARVPDTPQGRCQHQLRKEAERCRHGFAFGATCEPCILSCAGCWDMYSSSSTYGPRPTQPPQEPPR